MYNEKKNDFTEIIRVSPKRKPIKNVFFFSSFQNVSTDMRLSKALYMEY